MGHSIASSDPFYTDTRISIPDVQIYSTIFYDPVLPPFFKEAKFTDLLNGVLITFDKDTDQGGFTGSFECFELLNLTVTKKIEGTEWIGEGSMCSWTSSSQLKVTFGSEPTVVPGDVVRLADDMVRSSDAAASLRAMNQTTVILGPNSPTLPTIAINSPSAVGVCDDLKIDASSTSGSGGRTMKFNYTVECSGSICENVTKALDDFNTGSSGYGTHTVTIPSIIMPKDTRMVFQLEVSAELFMSCAIILHTNAFLLRPILNVITKFSLTTTEAAGSLPFHISISLPLPLFLLLLLFLSSSFPPLLSFLLYRDRSLDHISHFT